MKRREFVIATAGMAGVSLPMLGRTAVPCPPGTVSVSGGNSVTTSCGSGASYTTEFLLTENPISESGRWRQQGKLTGLDWANVQTGGGIAFGTQTGLGGYDDSIALLSGFSPNHRVTGVIHFSGNRSSETNTHEIELILRGYFAPHVQYLYECNIGYSGESGWASQIMRMDGAIGEFTGIGERVNNTPDINDGDIFMAEIIGSEINCYLNGEKLITAIDTTYASGQPGIGFFWRGSENISDFGFKSITVTNI